MVMAGPTTYCQIPNQYNIFGSSDKGMLGGIVNLQVSHYAKFVLNSNGWSSHVERNVNL